MKKLSFIILGLGVLIASPSLAFAKVDVFSCAPEWSALVQEVGGHAVDMYTASTAQ